MRHDGGNEIAERHQNAVVDDPGAFFAEEKAVRLGSEMFENVLRRVEVTNQNGLLAFL